MNYQSRARWRRASTEHAVLGQTSRSGGVLAGVTWPDTSGSEAGEEPVVAAPTRRQGRGGARGSHGEGKVAGRQWRERHARLRREGSGRAGCRGPDKEGR